MTSCNSRSITSWVAMASFSLLTSCGRAEIPTASEATPAAAASSPSELVPAPQPAAVVPSAPRPGAGGADAIAVSHLCVTSGAIEPRGDTRFAITAPTFRAVSSSPTEPHAEVRFTYLGPTAETRALGSGAVRQQLGLKLRAQDPCNLVYVMWRFEPENKLVVSVKRNPGARTSAECGNRGYSNLRGLLSAPVPPVSPGSSHALRAEIAGATLQVWADDVLVWKGDLGAEALAIDGPIGLRTDNVHVEAELRGAARGAAASCGQGGDGD